MKKEDRNWKRILLICAVVLILIIAAILIYRHLHANDDLIEGIDYIARLENTDPAKVEDEIRESSSKKKRQAVSKENSDSEKDSDSEEDTDSDEDSEEDSDSDEDSDIWSAFDDVVIVGDSRSYSFYEYEFLSSQHVLGGIGYSIDKTLEYLDTLKSLNPRFIVLVFGLNDVESKEPVEEYIEKMANVIDQIHEVLPKTTVFINSIIPTTQSAIAKIPAYGNIPEWNKQVKAYCEENQIPYIDIDKSIEENSDLYEPDGIHMQYAYFPIWGEEIIAEIREYEEQE